MNITIPGNTTSWELVAGIQLFQQIKDSDFISVAVVPTSTTDIDDLLYYSGIERSSGSLYTQPLQFAEAYRQVDDTDLSYVDVLARVSGMAMLKPEAPRFPLVTPHSNGGIVIAPFGLKRELDLSTSVWGPITQHLRSYKHTVYQIGERNQRQSFSGFTEAEVLCNRSVKDKLEALASAKLVVGIPNAWTWIAAGFGVKIVLLYPDHLPPKRWFPFSSDNFGRIAFQAHQVQTPVMLAGLRQLIKEM